MESLGPLFFRVLIGFAFIAMGVLGLITNSVIRNEAYEEDVRTGSSIIHRWARWYRERWVSSMGEGGYRAYSAFWSIVIILAGLAIMFGIVKP